MLTNRVIEAARQRADRALEPLVLECGDPPALVADDVMVVMLAAGQRGLVAGGLTTYVEPLEQMQPGERLEGPVDRRDADLTASGAQPVGDLPGADHAILASDQLEDRGARSARPVAGGP